MPIQCVSERQGTAADAGERAYVRRLGEGSSTSGNVGIVAGRAIAFTSVQKSAFKIIIKVMPILYRFFAFPPFARFQMTF